MDKKEFHTVRGYQLLERDKRMLTSAMEDYLEMIYRNSLKSGYIRINILSELLNVHPSSATKMVQKLARVGIVHYKKYGIIILTERGKAIGEFLYVRHDIIESFLRNLDLSDNILEETELIEHNISNRTLQNIYFYNSFIEQNPKIINDYKEFKKNILKRDE